MIDFEKPNEIRDDDQSVNHYGWIQMIIDFIKMLFYTARGGR